MVVDPGRPEDAAPSTAPEGGDASIHSPDASIDSPEASIDASIDSPNDAAHDATLDGPACDADLTRDPQNCGGCGQACTPPNDCIASACHSVIYYGRQALGNDYTGIAPETFNSIQFYIPQGGSALGIGVITSTANPDATTYPHAYLGLYADTGGGAPGQLVAMVNGGSMVATSPQRNEFAFSPPVSLGPGYYWLAGVFDESMPFAAQDGISQSWKYANLYAFGPLPDAAPAADSLSAASSIQPNFYLIVAQ
jgi:hypothetical protein